MARSPFGSPEQNRRSPEETRPPVETKPLETSGEEKAESFEDCKAEQKAAEQPEQQKLEEARENFDECAEREQETGDKVGAENPEDFDEDEYEYEECGGNYVARVEYRVTDPEQGAISQAEGDAAYQACEDPEDMQELTENLEARGGVEVESAEVIERPDPEVELHGTEEEKQEFIEAHEEADEAAEELEQAEEEAAEAREAAEAEEQAEQAAEQAEENAEQPEEVPENTEESPEDSEETTEENAEETTENPEDTAEQDAETDPEQDPESTGENPEEGEKTEEAPEQTEEDAEQPEGETAEQDAENPHEGEEPAENPEETPEGDGEQPAEDGEETEESAENPHEGEEPAENPEENPEGDGEQSPEDGEETEENAENPHEGEEPAEDPEENPEGDGEQSPEDEEESPEQGEADTGEETPEEGEESSRDAEEAPEEESEEDPEREEDSSEKDAENTEESPEEDPEKDAGENPEDGEEQEETPEETPEETEDSPEKDPDRQAEEAPEEEPEENLEKDTEQDPEDAPEQPDDPEAVREAREKGELPLAPEQAEEERIDIEKNAEKDGELLPDSDTFRRLSIEQHACEEQVEQTRQQLEEARRQAADSFANMPPFGSPEYKDALKAYNEARDRQQQLEEKLAQGKEQLEEVESTRRSLYQQAFDGKQQRLDEINQLSIRASEQQDRAEAQIYAERPSKEEMARIADSNTDLIRRLSDAEQGLDAMIAARQAQLAEYAARNNLGRWESEHDPQYLQMVKEQQEWMQKKSELSYLRAKAEEDNRQLEELQQQTKQGLFSSLAEKLRGRAGREETKNAESAPPKEAAEGGEYAELRRLGVEKIDLDECREEYRPQVIEAVKSMLEQNPEIVGQVREIRCWEMPNPDTYASYGPSEGDQPFGGVLNLNSTHFSDADLPKRLEENGKTGWMVPESSIRSVVTHEMGHAVHLELCALNNGVEHGQVPDREAYNRMVREYIDNRHADTIVETACKNYGIVFDSEAFADNLSVYGGSDYGEALAEAAAEAQTSEHPRPLASRIYAGLQSYKQRLMEQARQRREQAAAQTAAEQTAPADKQAAAGPENDFIRRLRRDAPTPQQQAEAVRRWKERQTTGNTGSADSDVMHGDGGARTRDTERDYER